MAGDARRQRVAHGDVAHPPVSAGPVCRRRGVGVVVQRVLAAGAGTPVGVAAGDGGFLRRRDAGGAVEFGGIGAAVTLLRRPVLHVQIIEALEQFGGGGTERVVHRVTEPALEQERHVEAAPREVVVDAREQLGGGVPADDAVGSGDCTVAVDIAHADVAGLLAVAPGDGGVGELPDADELVVVEHLTQPVVGRIRRVDADVDRLPDEPAIADVVRRAARQGDDEVAVVGEAQVGGPARPAFAARKIDRGDRGFPPPVLRLADVLEHLREAGRRRQRPRQQQVARPLPVPVDRAADAIVEQAEVYAHVELGGPLPHQVGIGDLAGTIT